MPEPTLRHLQIPNLPNRLDYAGQGSGGRALRGVDRAQHAAALRRQIEGIEAAAATLQTEQVERNLPAEVDLILELESADDFPLSAEHIHALTTGSTISLLNARPIRKENGTEATRVALHVPYGSLSILAEKVRRYGEDSTDRGNTPNAWIANLERVAIAALDALWTDVEPLPSDDEPHWWELWVRRNETVVASFNNLASALGVRIKGQPLLMPEHTIYVAEARRATLETSFDLLNTLAEVRHAHPCSIGLTDLAGTEQQEWIAEAVTRIDLPGQDAPAVCLLDTGINRGHDLLQSLLVDTDNHTVFPDGDRSDGWGGTGHGTLMAGLAAYGDLRSLMLSTQRWVQSYRLEGVKIINPTLPHEPENYGSITQQAVALPEIEAPTRQRVFVLAVTLAGLCTGQPSAWSAAIDAIAFGSEEDEEPKRLMLISAGNIDVFEIGTALRYPADNQAAPIEEPAQAWNAVTVGALTHLSVVQEDDPESRTLRPAAARGGLSPHSRTGEQWDAHWPIKPEIVMEGGNIGIHPQNGPERRDSLDLLSTAASFRVRPLSPMRATSAATALAARLAGELTALYPTYWPETIRGLLVHSARWNEVMLAGINPFRSYTKSERARLVTMLRTFGYGEPNVNRACYSSEQAVTLLREDTITPYHGAAGAAGLSDCHIHQLRLPSALLREQGNVTCTMRVTLSYFTAPNPSASNRIPGSRYRYGGCLLRFRVRHKDEDEATFERQVSREAAEDEELESLADTAWALGSRLRGKAGSLVHDVWQGNAADLAQMDRIGVYPVKGWWASKSFRVGSPWHRCHLRSIRYSLIVSIEISANVPIYTEIRNLLAVPVDLDA